MAKEQAIGQMAMAEENYAALMLVFGKSLIDHGKIDPLERIFEQIRSTTAEEVLAIAEEIFKNLLDNITNSLILIWHSQKVQNIISTH